MSAVSSPPLTFQYASSAAHTTPIHRGRTQTRQTLEVPIRNANRSSSASSTMSNLSTKLRGFYEHEEYERIEKVLLERIESLHRLNNPAYARKLRDCESRLEDVRYKLAKAHEKFSLESDDDRAPGMGSSDDEDEISPKALDTDSTQPISIAVMASDSASNVKSAMNDDPANPTTYNGGSTV